MRAEFKNWEIILVVGSVLAPFFVGAVIDAASAGRSPALDLAVPIAAAVGLFGALVVVFGRRWLKRTQGEKQEHLTDLFVKAKFGMACSIATMLVMVLSLNPEMVDLPLPAAGPYGFKGPLLGLVLAATMLVLLVVDHSGGSPMEAASRWILKGTGAGAAVLGGWEWLAVETDGNPIPYLNVVAAAMIVVGVGAGIGMLVGLAPGWLARFRS